MGSFSLGIGAVNLFLLFPDSLDKDEYEYDYGETSTGTGDPQPVDDSVEIRDLKITFFCCFLKKRFYIFYNSRFGKRYFSTLFLLFFITHKF